MSVGNNYLGSTVTAFTLVGSLNAPTVVTINDDCNFTGAGDKIHLTTTKVLLRAAVGDLSKSNKLCNCAVLNSLLLLPFLTKAVVLEGETAAGELLKTFADKILEHGSESTTKELEDDSTSK